MKKPGKSENQEIAGQLRSPHGKKGIETAVHMAEKNADMIRATLELINFNNVFEVLEFGFGNGSHVKEILQKGSDIRYTGIDISELMVEQAMEINKEWIHMGKADFLLTDGRSIPLENGRFDTVFSVNTIYFWEEPEGYLQEIAGVMKPGGKLLLTFAAKAFMEKFPLTEYGFKVYDHSEVSRMLDISGFTELSAKIRTDHTVSVTGKTIEREFVIVSGMKESLNLD